MASTQLGELRTPRWHFPLDRCCLTILEWPPYVSQTYAAVRMDVLCVFSAFFACRTVCTTSTSCVDSEDRVWSSDAKHLPGITHHSR